MLIALTFMRLRLMGRRYNIEKAKRLIRSSKEKGAKLVVLPSMFPVGSIIEVIDNEKRLKNMIKNLSEKIRGTATDAIINLAIEGEVHLIAGPILEQAGPKIFLTTIFVSPQGEIIGKYRKLSPSERDIFLGLSPGKEPMSLVLDKKYGIIAEDDIYVPEISRILALSGCSAIISTARAVQARTDSVKHVAISRSIENGVPYLVAGQVVEDENGEERVRAPTFIVSADGEQVREAEEEDSILMVDSSVLYRSKDIARNSSLTNIITGLYKSMKKSKAELLQRRTQGKGV